MSDSWPDIQFVQPAWLALLIVAVPWLVWWRRRSLAELTAKRMSQSLGLRITICGLLLLALTNVIVWYPSPKLFVVFAADHSRSIDTAAAEARDSYIAQVVSAYKASGRADRSWNFVRFAATGLVQDTFPGGPATAVDPDWSQQTDLGAAIELCTALAPTDASAQIVLLTDGNSTRGDDERIAIPAALPISCVALTNSTPPEIRISRFDVPPQVVIGEPFRIAVHVESTLATIVKIEVAADQQNVIAETRELTVGSNTFVFSHRIDRATQLTARVLAIDGNPLTADTRFAANSQTPADPSDAAARTDTAAENNQVEAFVFAVAGSVVLLIESASESNDAFVRAVEAEGIRIERRSATAIPRSLAGFGEFSAIILADVPATDLTTSQMELMRRFVSHSGGGLLMLGGGQSFGLGGYYRTAVEEVLPVACDFHKQQDKPGLGMMLVIDKSGSMGGQKIELAKDAAKAAVELLDPNDQVGVIAFDGSAHWVSPLETLSDKAAVLNRISAIEVGGGTSLYPALVDSHQALRASTARLKHVIALSDGYSIPAPFEQIAAELAAAKITVSTVGIADGDPELLQMIARIGHGRYYFTNDPKTVPQIFAKETLMAGDSAINEDPFVPRQFGTTPVLAGIDFRTSSPLLGHVMTRPKPGSEIVLLTEAGEPLLSWWRYGLGTTVAFTSDSGQRWTAPWLTWPDFSRFWAQIIRHMARRDAAGGFNVDATYENRRVRVRIDSRDPDGRLVNGAETLITVEPPSTLSPVTAVGPVSAVQTGPGTYEAEFPAERSGVWRIGVRESVAGQLTQQQFRTVNASQTDEFIPRPPNLAVLKSISDSSGGLFNPSAEQLIERLSHPDAKQKPVRSVPLRPCLLSIALVLFVIDVATRRLPM